MLQFRALCLALIFGSSPWILASARQTTVPKPSAPAALRSEKSTSTAPRVEHPLETADLTAFFDGIIPLQLERSDVAGATVLVMKDGQVLLAKGYGYSDLSKKTPVDPATTMFRLASISKLFTWTAVMQLVEQGRLSLDTDINQYLDFPIAPAFGKPITLRNMMTHTGGFEDTVRDLIVTDPKLASTLRDYLIQNQPRRLFPPGEVAAYSNYGVGLAGYIVQRMSNEPYESYVAEHIFEPLGMSHSTFRQPPQEALFSFVSYGYPTSTEKSPVGFEIISPAPAGALSTTASDMGRFAQALLNGGELEGHRILKPETLQAMWTRQYAASDRMPAMCMGFYQVWRNGLHFIGHEGDLLAFHSMFFLEPSLKLALFVSYNSAGSASKTRDEILRMFADRYYPYAPPPLDQKTTDAEFQAMVGTYETTRRSDSTKSRLGALISEVHATADPKAGVLRLDDLKDLRNHVQKWKFAGNDLWREEDGQDRLFGIRDASGKVDRLAFDFPGRQLQRVPWYENDRLIYILLGGSVATLLLVVLASLVRFVRRLFFRSRLRLQPQPGTAWLTFGPRLAAFAWITLAIFVAAVIASLVGDNTLPPSHEADKYFVVFNLLAGLAIFFSLFAVRAAAQALQKKDLRAISRVKFSLVALACAFLTWFSIHWNIIGPAHRF